MSVAKSPLAKMAQRGLEVFMAVFEISDSTWAILRPSHAQGKKNRICYEVTPLIVLQRMAGFLFSDATRIVWTSIQKCLNGARECHAAANGTSCCASAIASSDNVAIASSRCAAFEAP